MTQSRLRALIIEDNPGDARLVREALAASEDFIHIEQLESLSEALKKLSGESFDVILLDLSLPDSRGFETFARVHAHSPSTPIILFTGLDDEKLALRAMQNGAQDYLIKDTLDRRWLPRIVRYAVERKRAEELARSNVSLERFAMTASHELQEPLRKIMAFGAILTRRHGKELSPAGQKFLERMVSAADRMARLVCDLLEFSRMAQDPGTPKAVDLSDPVSEALENLESLIADSGAAAIEVERLPTVHANQAQMRQLFQNLLSNALKFQLPGQPLRVSLTSRPLGAGFVEVAVQDNGPGFDARQPELLFAPFARGARRGGPQGSGIGLATCRAIVLRHGGWISAEGEPGRGATVKVALPLGDAHVA